MLDLEVDIYEMGFDDGIYAAKFGIERRPSPFIENQIYQDGFTEGFKRQIIIDEERELEE